MVTFTLACVIAISVSFICSLLEATLLSLDHLHLETKRREGLRYAVIWHQLRQRIDRPIAAILILNTVAHTGGATVAGSAFDEIFGDEWIWVFSVVFTVVVLVGTEIIPKVIGITYAERVAPLTARLLSFMTLALTPVIALTEWVSRPFKRTGAKPRLSLADLRTFADLARRERLIGVEEENIIINATKLRYLSVASVMVPSERMVLFDARQPNVANFEIAASSLHTRYPVSRDGTVDGIVGYVNFKEIVAMMPSRREAQIQPFIRPLPRLAANASLNEALKALLGRREHVALVEDEQHRTVGMVTLEDMLEEIVGDLPDEFDQPSTEIIEVAEHRWKLGGGASLREIQRQTGLALSADSTEVVLGEWLRLQLGREVRVGDTLRAGTARLTVIQTRRRKAHRVLVETA